MNTSVHTWPPDSENQPQKDSKPFHCTKSEAPKLYVSYAPVQGLFFKTGRSSTVEPFRQSKHPWLVGLSDAGGRSEKCFSLVFPCFLVRWEAFGDSRNQKLRTGLLALLLGAIGRYEWGSWHRYERSILTSYLLPIRTDRMTRPSRLGNAQVGRRWALASPTSFRPGGRASPGQ